MVSASMNLSTAYQGDHYNMLRQLLSLGGWTAAYVSWRIKINYRGERSSAKFWGTDGQEMGAVNGFLMDTVAISVSGHQRRQEWEAGMEFPFWLFTGFAKCLGLWRTLVEDYL